MLDHNTTGMPFAFNLHTGDVSNSVVIGLPSQGMTFNPIALFAVDTDACLQLLQQAAMVDLQDDDLALAKSTGLRVAESQTPSVRALVEAWKQEPSLTIFAAAVAHVMLPN